MITKTTARKILLHIALTLGVAFPSVSIHAQRVCNDLYIKKFSRTELDSDLNFIREKILNAHANPFTEINRTQFDSKVAEIRNQLKDGMTQREFYLLSKPLIVTLNDEHSAMADYCVTDSIKNSIKVLPLRFKYENGKMVVSENFSNQPVETGEEVVSLNNIPISDVLNNCAKAIPGSKEERIPMAVDRFWVVINKFCYFITDDYNFKFKSGKQMLVKSIPLQDLQKAYAEKNPPKPQSDNKIIDFEKINKVGYLTVNAFDKRTMPEEVWRKKLDSIFSTIKKDKIRKLAIDVSNNGGGDSSLGDMLISYFSQKPYKTYQGTWRKSAEYSQFLKTLGKNYPDYEKLKNGDNLTMSSELRNPAENPLLFKGKTYVIVGQNTFSSAMMFAVIVLDNKLATVVGEVPDRGHPNHFGELIKFTTPNTNLDFYFGVKEWIRPAGKIEPNKLIPDKIITLKNKTKEQIIEQF